MKLFMKDLKNAVKCTVVLGVLWTVIYPAALTLAGQALFPKQANGSMVMAVIDGEERAVGSKYVGQQFEDPRVFHGRISSVNYNCYTQEEKEDTTDGKLHNTNGCSPERDCNTADGNRGKKGKYAGIKINAACSRRKGGNLCK